MVAIQNQIEIKAAGPPVLKADAAKVLFRTQEQLQQRFSRQFGLQQGTAVDEVILNGANWHGAIPTGMADKADLGMLVKGLEGVLQDGGRVADVAAQGDGGPGDGSWGLGHGDGVEGQGHFCAPVNPNRAIGAAPAPSRGRLYRGYPGGP